MKLLCVMINRQILFPGVLMILVLLWILLGSLLTIVALAGILWLVNKVLKEDAKREWRRETEAERSLRSH